MVVAAHRSMVSQRSRIRKYCQQQRLTEKTLRRWLKRLAGNETALNLEKYETELRHERAREEREKAYASGEDHRLRASWLER